MVGVPVSRAVIDMVRGVGAGGGASCAACRGTRVGDILADHTVTVHTHSRTRRRTRHTRFRSLH
eukprot:7384392-Prymnesium_polylepis.2